MRGESHRRATQQLRQSQIVSTGRYRGTEHTEHTGTRGNHRTPPPRGQPITREPGDHPGPEPAAQR
ncbi:hypothetical protein [Nocardia brasiliensis]|uniref:hypothetical protein n=1 Tax=Nocardia brasiliensis TaxID=37326 RepID=UPI00245786BE|nr:hypothetical protein [Nocardia brasiliensis]